MGPTPTDYLVDSPLETSIGSERVGGLTRNVTLMDALRSCENEKRS